MSRLTDLQIAAATDPDGFWLDAARAIDWIIPPERARSDEKGWFPEAKLNSCYNALDRHVARGLRDARALIHVSAMNGREECWTFAELLEEVARVAGMLAAEGVRRGDRVVIYMPMVPEAVFGMLACARLGAVHSVVFGGFAAAELAKRIDDSRPLLLLTATCGLEPGRVVPYLPLIEAAIALAEHVVERVVVLRRPELPDMPSSPVYRDWEQLCAVAGAHPCVAVSSTDPLYILYTSGTTGGPKGVVRDNGGHAVALAWSMANVYAVCPGDLFWAASDIGWVVGHSYIVYGPLIAGCATLLFEGKPVGTPDAGTYWRIAQRYGVTTLFTAPTALRAIRREDPEADALPRAGLPALRALFLAGERADPNIVAWAERILGVPVIDHWWQTELGWPALATCLGLEEWETRRGSAGRPVPGFRFAALDACDQPVSVGEEGDLVIELPLPPGCLTTLWNDAESFTASYFTQHRGVYTTGDAGLIDADGFVHVMGRIDDIINVAGHRISTGSIEQLIAGHADVAECAVVGAADALKGQVPLALVVRRAAVDVSEADTAAELVATVREGFGPVASLRDVAIVPMLPKTRSGKVLRRVIRLLADGRQFTAPATIENPAALTAAAAGLARLGYPRKERCDATE